MSDANRESEAAARPDGEQPPAMPRWVRLSLIVAGVLLLVLVALKLTGAGGQHGPGRHQGAGQQPGYVAVVSVHSGWPVSGALAPQE